VYRWLILGPLVAFCAISAVVARQAVAGIILGTPAIVALSPAWLEQISPALALAMGALLVWLAAFQPGRRYPPRVAGLKYASAAGAAALGWAVLLERGAWAGWQAAALATQVARPLPVLLAAAWLPRSLVEALALSAVAAAPLYWLVRTVQVRSLRRATFEGWLETRRLILPAALLLIAAAALDAWIGPMLVSWALG
jgi:hypothetical protein